MPKLSIVIPCYQAEQNIPITIDVVLKNEKNFPEEVEFEYILVDDGSTDETFKEMMKFHERDPQKFKIVKLSRNFGANNASMAGLQRTSGDCVSLLAVDLQDPPELIAKMYGYWQQGIKLIIANREDRKDSFVKNFFAGIYHFVMRLIFPTKVPKGGFDLVLFDRQVCDELIGLEEKNAYLPYLWMWLGYDYVSIPYTRRKREVGRSMWTVPKQIKAFIDSVVAFSYLPIRLISIVGMVLGFLAIGYVANILYYKLTGGAEIVDGWASLMVVLLVVSCFQMIALGVIGEYVWRALDSSRKRPNFIVDKVYGIGGPDD